MKKYELTEEHKAELEKLKKFWIQNALRTESFTEEERSKFRQAMRGLYANAKLDYPGDDKIIFVSSPMVAQFAYARAMELLNPQAARQADQAAYQAAYQAERQAARQAEQAARKNDWFNFSLNIFLKIFRTKFGLFSLSFSYRCRTGGNFWPWRSLFGSFFRDVAKLKSDWDKFTPWEEASRYGSVRYMHPKFTIVSDRPEILRLDNEGRPHCEDGPSHRWRDGLEFYHLHGIRVPQWVIRTSKNAFTKEMILSEPNADIRREIIRKIGIEKAIDLLGAEVVDTEAFEIGGVYELLMVDYDGRGEKRPYLKMKNPSIDAYHIEGVEPSCRTVKQALMYRNGLKAFALPEAIS